MAVVPIYSKLNCVERCLGKEGALPHRPNSTCYLRSDQTEDLVYTLLLACLDSRLQATGATGAVLLAQNCFFRSPHLCILLLWLSFTAPFTILFLYTLYIYIASTG
jgi:hypothetical protein